MRVLDLIRKKRQGDELTEDELKSLITGYTAGDIPDYQMAAFCMAVVFQGMTSRETSYLTMAMARSGKVLDLGGIQGRKIDKHSTGGVGDTTTLVVAPLVASCGVPVAKVSGRGLGHSGGTIDKLESICGFRVELSQQEFISQVNRIGVCVIGQTAELAPADKKLYALRDVTGTVESIPLIASSIMSKKVSAGADGVVLDVKTGKGAFMQDPDDAVALARSMVAIGSHSGKDTVALVTDMSEPLGRAVGNALEVKEAILTLSNQGGYALTEVCLLLATEMLLLAGITSSERAARELLERRLTNGDGLSKFGEMIAAQGGDNRVIEDPSLLPQAPVCWEVQADQRGYIQCVDPLTVGQAAAQLGAGRITKESTVDLAVGIELRKRVTDYVECGEVLAVMHAQTRDAAKTCGDMVKRAVTIGKVPTVPNPLLYQKITANET